MNSCDTQPARQVMATHAKTFSLAARFLPASQVDGIAELYALCRYADDLADEGPAGCHAGELDQLRQDIAAGLPTTAASQNFILLQAQYGIPTQIALDFIDELCRDQFPRRFYDTDELVRFSYGVASTVGLMMCHVFGVDDAEAHPFAIDLGIAMQMTNVCRDVLEDAERGRVYVPARLAGIELQPELIVAGDDAQRRAAFKAVQQLLGIADDYYASARRGIHFLPPAVRPAVLVAADVYRGIGAEISRQPWAYWRQRAVVPRRRKAVLALAALAACYFDPVVRGRAAAPLHQTQLHAPLVQRAA